MNIEELLEKLNSAIEIKKYTTLEALSNELLKLYCNKIMYDIDDYKVFNLSILDDDVYFEIHNIVKEKKHCYLIPLSRMEDIFLHATANHNVADGISILEEFNGQCF
jgi:hypothetical protein